MSVRVTKLGQAGFRLQFGGTSIYIDPYLSDSVEQMEGPRLKRLLPAPFQAHQVTDANYVLISHIHMDHCDIDTLLPLSKASPSCFFIGPMNVIRYLVSQGISVERTIVADKESILLNGKIEVHPIPAAHKNIEQDFDGYLRYLGYVISYNEKLYLHTGDTCVHSTVIESIRQLGKIDIAFLPVNECNYFRDRAGIVGNMSIREAFHFAEEVGASTVIPMHYDMFEPNQAYPEEIQMIYDKMSPSFTLNMEPSEV